MHFSLFQLPAWVAQFSIFRSNFDDAMATLNKVKVTNLQLQRYLLQPETSVWPFIDQFLPLPFVYIDRLRAVFEKIVESGCCGLEGENLRLIVQREYIVVVFLRLFK